MVQVIERAEGRYDLREVEFGGVTEKGSLEHVVLECGCRARMVLDGHGSIRHPLTRSGVLECGVCGERFVITRVTAQGLEERYSWLEDGLPRLAGKEARQEYYARL